MFSTEIRQRLGVLLILAVMAGIALAQVDRPDGPDEKRMVRCANGWCMISEPALRELLDGLKQLSEHAKTLRQLCGWEAP